ncbi:MAG: GNAT family N-acetyltransferase [Flavobacterium sp.]|uniref:GNAT family N-acetyltransferase n=1 Tax=Flavobacterium sp. TaxID=239 RepID=UPI003267D25B
MNMIKEITTQETFLVRNLVLRSGKPVETCFFDGDNLEQTKHFGYFDNGNIIGVVSVYKNKNSIFKFPNQYQIRGMAILEEFQGSGCGKLLVKHCEGYLTSNYANLIWFNARETAVTFYEKLGYTKNGFPFPIADVGIHFLMFKNL